MKKFTELVSVGKETEKDFYDLGIETIAQLARQSHVELYQRLCELRGEPVDICCQDVFQAAILQAKNPGCSKEQKQWWYWSRVRKEASSC